MPSQTITFQKALEMVESLPEYQQENLLDIIQRRLVDHKRELLAQSIKAARQEYARGEVKTGNVADLIRDVSK